MIGFVYYLKLNCIFIAIIFLTKICLIKKMYVYLPHKKAIPPYLCRQVAKSQLKPPFGCDLPRWLRMANYLEKPKVSISG